DVLENTRMAIARLEDKLDEFAAGDTETERLHKIWVQKNEEIIADNLKRQQEKKPPHKLPPQPESERAAFGDALVACEHALTVKQQAVNDPQFREELTKLRFNEIKAKDLENTGTFGLFKLAEGALQTAISKYPKFARTHYELALCELLVHR